MRSFLIVLALVVASGARAQESAPPAPAVPQPSPAPPLIRAPDEPEPEPTPPTAAPVALTDVPIALVPGADVRIETRTERFSGPLAVLEPGALSLQAEPQRVSNILLDDVQRLSVRKRAVLPSALVGAGTGGVVLALLASVACVASEDLGSVAAVCGLVGGAVGTAFGAAAGALVGLAVPRWSTVYDREAQGGRSPRLVEDETEQDSAAGWLLHPGPLGEAGLQVGYGRRLDRHGDATDAGMGVRLHLLARFGPYVAFGPEAAVYSHVGTTRFVGPGVPTFVRDQPLFQLGGLLRVGAEFGRVRPAALLGLAWYEGDFSHVAYSVGAEVAVRLVEDWPPLVVDGRYHDNLQRLGEDPRYLTLGVGSRVVW